MRRMSLGRMLLLAAAALWAGATFAQEWKPGGTVRLVVPNQGGPVDLIARLVAPKLQEAFQQPVIVENRPGGGGNIGADVVAKAAPDGETLLVGFTAPITVNVTLFKSLPYDPQKDLAPITLAVTVAALSVGFVSVLGLLRARLRADADVSGRRSVVAGIAGLGFVAAGAATFHLATPSPLEGLARVGVLYLSSGALVTLGIYVPWIAVRGPHVHSHLRSFAARPRD